MVKRKIPKASKTRLICFGSICVLIISYFIINSFSMIFNIKELSLEQQNLQNNLVSLQEEELNLTKELSKLKNDEYKAKYARENFLYSKEEGEYIFTTILDEAETTTQIDENEHNYNYIIVGIIVLLLLVILFIIKRIRKVDKKV